MPESSRRKKRNRSSSRSDGNQAKKTRSKSVFRGDQDPYFPKANTQPASSHTAGDWAFRLKVICSDNPSGELLQEAVQGLVSICFPQGILEQLGLSVVLKHMKEAKAPKQNVDRVRTIFESEMVHKLSWLLAEKLGDDEKLQAGISSVVAATNRLHFQKLDTEIVDDIIAVFQRLRIQLSATQSDQLASGGGLRFPIEEDIRHRIKARHGSRSEDSSSDEEDHESISSNDSDSDDDDDALPKRKKNTPSPATSDTDEPDNSKKGRRVLTRTRRWDIDPKFAIAEDIKYHFKRKSDLFAFHAYPIVQRDLGPRASDAEILKTIEKLFIQIPPSEMRKWGLSLTRLRHGDLAMLNRAAPEKSPREIGSTPFPPAASTRSAGRLQSGTDGEAGSRPSRETKVKPESEADARERLDLSSRLSHVSLDLKEEVEVDFPRPSDDSTRMVSRARLNTVLENAPATTPPSLLPNELGARRKSTLPLQHSYRYPVLNLLLAGKWYRWSDRADLAATLLRELDKRTTANSFNYTDGSITKNLSKADIYQFIMTHDNYNSIAVKMGDKLEDMLIPWVITNLAAFQELASPEFIFAHTMPFTHPVLDLICGHTFRIQGDTKNKVKEHVLRSLGHRGIHENYSFGTYTSPPLGKILGQTISNHNFRDPSLRLILERTLRCVVIREKHKFPHVRRLEVVREWERLTGLKW